MVTWRLQHDGLGRWHILRITVPPLPPRIGVPGAGLDVVPLRVLGVVTGLGVLHVPVLPLKRWGA